MKLVTVILDSSSQISSSVRNLETTHFPLYSRLGAKCGAVERGPSRDFREARFWITSGLPTSRELIGLVNRGAFSGTDSHNLLERRRDPDAWMGFTTTYKTRGDCQTQRK